MWKVVCAKQEQALTMKNEFFERGLFVKMSRCVFDSFRSICVLELNRLVYLFKGLSEFYSKPQLFPENQSLNLFAKNFIKFAKGNCLFLGICIRIKVCIHRILYMLMGIGLL